MTTKQLTGWVLLEDKGVILGILVLQELLVLLFLGLAVAVVAGVSLRE